MSSTTIFSMKRNIPYSSNGGDLADMIIAPVILSRIQPEHLMSAPGTDEYVAEATEVMALYRQVVFERVQFFKDIAVAYYEGIDPSEHPELLADFQYYLPGYGGSEAAVTVWGKIGSKSSGNTMTLTITDRSNPIEVIAGMIAWDSLYSDITDTMSDGVDMGKFGKLPYYDWTSGASHRIKESSRKPLLTTNNTAEAVVCESVEGLRALKDEAVAKVKIGKTAFKSSKGKNDAKLEFYAYTVDGFGNPVLEMKPTVFVFGGRDGFDDVVKSLTDYNKDFDGTKDVVINTPGWLTCTKRISARTGNAWYSEPVIEFD